MKAITSRASHPEKEGARKRDEEKQKIEESKIEP